MKFSTKDLVNQKHGKFFLNFICAAMGNHPQIENEMDLILTMNGKEIPIEEAIKWLEDSYRESVLEEARSLISAKLEDSLYELSNQMSDLAERAKDTIPYE